MDKIKGFLIAESMTGLMVAVIGVSIFALIVAQNQKIETAMEAKTDRAYAWHVMREHKLDSVKVHSHIYKLKGSYVYDTTTKQEYKIK
ncbi:hypothetical protein [Lactobacillus intestinalis]|uniref:hypothetical protein n=1 Tax=Lactobacillus intestinalis TaxID=151781 RepID=UPI002632EDEF|nr:hypothetical protein [Lactobacillus intestinalis]